MAICDYCGDYGKQTTFVPEEGYLCKPCQEEVSNLRKQEEEENEKFSRELTPEELAEEERLDREEEERLMLQEIKHWEEEEEARRDREEPHWV